RLPEFLSYSWYKPRTQSEPYTFCHFCGQNVHNENNGRAPTLVLCAALLARRTRMLRRCSIDARSQGSLWPLPFRGGEEDWRALARANRRKTPLDRAECHEEGCCSKREVPSVEGTAIVQGPIRRSGMNDTGHR